METVSPLHPEGSSSGSGRSPNEDNANNGSPIAPVGGGTSTGQAYIASFSSRRHLMPHWRNVLAAPRIDQCGSVTVLSFTRRARGLGLQSSHELSGSDLNASSLTAALGLDPGAALSLESNQRLLPRGVLVSDLSKPLINILGPTFHLSPEVFEEHLVRSGYTTTSYWDRDSSTWPTRFLHNKYISSLRWYSLVLRKDMEPRDSHSRNLLLGGYLNWERYFRRVEPQEEIIKHERFLSTSTNIWRQEWPISSVNRPLKRRLILREDGKCLVDTSEEDELEEVNSINHRPNEELDLVAWEEKVTFCWGRLDQGRVPIFFFDPLPHMRLNNTIVSAHGLVAQTLNLLPFSKRLAPRGPPPVQQFHDDPTALDAVSAYATATNDARSDAAAWISHLAEQPALQESRSTVDLLLLSVFELVRRDTLVLLGHIGDVLDQISSGSMDERMMQEHLQHWRTVLSRWQKELPALEQSMGQFFVFPYARVEDEVSPPPARISAALCELQAATGAMAARCKGVQESLRAEMSLLESKRGIEEAESVSRLTELAFIFIPLTFTAGLFSMQIKELADKPPPAYGFIIAAVVTMTISYGLRLVQRSNMVTEPLRRLENTIRHDEQVESRIIPIRRIAHWLIRKLYLKYAIPIIVFSSVISMYITAYWY